MLAVGSLWPSSALSRTTPTPAEGECAWTSGSVVGPSATCGVATKPEAQPGLA